MSTAALDRANAKYDAAFAELQRSLVRLKRPGATWAAVAVALAAVVRCRWQQYRYMRRLDAYVAEVDAEKAAADAWKARLDAQLASAERLWVEIAAADTIEQKRQLARCWFADNE